MSERKLVDVSVVLVVKDEPSIARSLALLEPQCMQNNAECIVVDASSGRLDSIAQEYGWVRWIPYEQPSNRRFTISHQRNIGVRAATSDLVAFCDAGGEPDPDWLRTLIDALIDSGGVCVCGPTLSIDKFANPPVNLLDDGSLVELPATGNMAFFKKTFESVGGFDERFDHGEDLDFGWRMIESGGVVTSARHAIMRMYFGDFHRQLRRAWFYGRATPYILRRHRRLGFRYLVAYPDNIVYPAWLCGFSVTLVAGWFEWWIPIAWISLLGIILIKNYGEPKKRNFFSFKIVRAIGFLSSIPRAIFAPMWQRAWPLNSPEIEQKSV